ncbi:Ribosomal large subunit pseudouridine synthase C [hydrothermal vent metagenome]|uniref:Ribosomal large subunit pseudouridine synthase C n=1 Tax=hydrothermal vent metagenome TaxID=652676 RepID=A0A1W1C4D8_9ZZZZ
MPKFQTISETAEYQRLDNFLIKTLKGVPKSHIHRIIRKGEVRVNKGRKKSDYKLQIGDIVRIPPVRISEKIEQKVSSKLIGILENSLLYEDKGLMIFNKPSGLAVHGGSGINLGLIETLRQIYGNHLELVHRLDRETSGCILIAKKRSVLKNIQQQLSENKLKKIYLALVQNSWAKKTHTTNLPLLKNTIKSGERIVIVDNNGKEAISHFRPIENFTKANFSASLVEVKIDTGRTHQIRVHAQEVGHPIANDTKYGNKTFNQQLQRLGLKRLFLHAKQLEFFNPTLDKKQNIQAPLPVELKKILSLLK